MITMQLEIILATSSNQEVMEEDMEIEEIRQTSNKRKENKKFLLEDSLMRLQMMKSLNSLRRVMFNLMNLEHSKMIKVNLKVYALAYVIQLKMSKKLCN